MKKVLLSAFALGAFLVSHSQGIAVTDTLKDVTTEFPYLGANFAQDDFAEGRSYGTEDAGLYWWPDVSETKPAMGTIGTPEYRGEYTASRDSVAGGMKFTVTNPTKRYEPVGVGFGGDEATPAVIDLSDNASFSITLRNEGTETTLVRIALQDVNLKLIDAKEAGVPHSEANPVWNRSIQIQLVAGEEETFSMSSADILAGGEAKYPDGVDPIVEGGFDFTQVKGVNVTIVSTNQENVGIEGAVIVVKNFKLGATPITSVSKSIAQQNLAIYPNPSSDVVNLGKTVINPVLYNAQGTPVFSAAKADVIEVANLESGVYLLQAENGRAKIVVE